MTDSNQPTDSLQDIHEIKRMMERSSRFISLSGLSGVAAGISALVASYLAEVKISTYYKHFNKTGFSSTDFAKLKWNLVATAVILVAVALSISFYFTWRRARKNSAALWGPASRRLIWSILVPFVSGALFIVAMLQYNEWRFIASGCLIFYGLALVNGSKYTLSDIRYLGYLEIILGLVGTQFIGYGLYLWAFGFGVLHIVYGLSMWWKYEKK